MPPKLRLLWLGVLPALLIHSHIGLLPAADTWNGANVTGGTGGTDVNDSANWTDGVVPIAGHDALFNWNASNAGPPARVDLVIPNAGTFAPDGMIQLLDSVTNGSNKITLQKSLAFSQLRIQLSGSSGGTANSRFVIDSGVTVNLTGATPIDLSTGFTGWQSILLGTAGADSAVTVNLSGASITLNSLGITGNANVDGNSSGLGGGVNNSQAGMGPQLNFTAVGGAVELASGGVGEPARSPWATSTSPSAVIRLGPTRPDWVSSPSDTVGTQQG